MYLGLKKVLGVLLIIAGAIGGFYVGGWLMLIKPVIDVCVAFDAGILTGAIIGTTILKCVFSGFVGWIIFYIGYYIGCYLIIVD